jgi:hypothetical protein
VGHPPDPQRLVYLIVPTGQPYGASNAGDSDSSFSLPVFEALRNRARGFSDVMAFVPLNAIHCTGPGSATPLSTLTVVEPSRVF